MFNLFNKPTPSGEQTVLKIKGMHCTSCAMTIDDALEETDGVLEANTNFAKAETKVSFDPEKVSKAQLAKVVAEQGYQVE